MSGAFNGLGEIIEKRVAPTRHGLWRNPEIQKDETDYLRYLKAEDLTRFGFESEFVGRLPVKVCFEKLDEKDLHQILASIPTTPSSWARNWISTPTALASSSNDQVLARGGRPGL